ncbi:unnamed protein product [Paramecium sonneborni]|uniref:Uncharacterized protein n=1 Tax=Paramecium sonneborni TaxID=65129 RepID=A0A8S1RKN8_9CILI|nr:unnamed protein product [Paramecium sonneborni]
MKKKFDFKLNLQGLNEEPQEEEISSKRTISLQKDIAKSKIENNLILIEKSYKNENYLLIFKLQNLIDLIRSTILQQMLLNQDLRRDVKQQVQLTFRIIQDCLLQDIRAAQLTAQRGYLSRKLLKHYFKELPQQLRAEYFGSLLTLYKESLRQQQQNIFDFSSMGSGIKVEKKVTWPFIEGFGFCIWIKMENVNLMNRIWEYKKQQVFMNKDNKEKGEQNVLY